MTDAVDLSRAIAQPGERWDQGDIVDGVYFAAFDKSMPAVLVTPACDIEQEKVDLWTFVALFPDVDVARATVSKELASWRAGGGSVSTKQRTSLANTVRGLITQRLPRYHWLPVTIGASAGHVADFSCVTALPVAEVKERTARLVTLRSSWREQLPARYAAYMARVGTQDFKEEAVVAQIDRLVAAVLAD